MIVFDIISIYTVSEIGPKSTLIILTPLNLTFFTLDEIAHSKNPLASWMITLPDLIAPSAILLQVPPKPLHGPLPSPASK